ncbi:EamA family transporter [Tellurirhabdus bombi]|uniref:EamA family transporter n=1 Tax=Tellurirhabdus bombi TaxID=2907205 RepID=UPI001F3014AC|nr:EamA family transporter [Tellurirhabdus bombi]
MNSHKLVILAAFAAIYIIWGSTYLAALIGLGSFPPLLMAGLRFSSAGLILLVWCLVKGETLPSANFVRKNALGGILMLVGGTGSVIWAEQYIPSGMAAILVASLPFWFVLLDRHQWATYFSNKLIIGGLLLGFAGILLLFGFNSTPQTTSRAGMQMVSIVVLVLGSIAWVVGSLYTKYQPSTGSTTMNASLQLLAAGPFSLLLSGILGEFNGFAIGAVSVNAWLALAYMTIMGSLVAYLAYIYLLQVRPPAQVGTYAYVNPVIAVLLGWQFANEPITSQQLLALSMILCGVLLVNLPKYQSAKT